MGDSGVGILELKIESQNLNKKHSRLASKRILSFFDICFFFHASSELAEVLGICIVVVEVLLEFIVLARCSERGMNCYSKFMS
ncbi:hypothetical protein KY285_032463 [Solanum tuberosum]|nr:hypothetical protein KY285_032463 [Solanum tuberosum]